MKYLISFFLAAHGLLHLSYLTPKPDDPNYPFDFTRGWFADIVGSTAGAIGATLVTVTALAFIVAALAYVGVPGFVDFGKAAAVTGAISSLILLILFWHTWLILGVVIDLVILYGIFQLNWKIGA